MLLFRPHTDNVKTGYVPTAWVGPTLADIEASCTGCPLFKRSCYAWQGRVRMSMLHLLRAAAENPAAYTLDFALRHAPRSARMVRVSAIGDPRVVPFEDAQTLVAKVARAGLALVGYTHFWRDPEVARTWRGHLMASCESAAQADAALSAGWRATFILRRGTTATRGKTPGGNTWVLCPAQVDPKPGRERVTCNTCRLCAASTPGPIVAFRGHGPVRQVERAVVAATLTSNGEAP